MTFHYAVRGLMVREDVLGTSFCLPANGREVTLVFPLTEERQEGPTSMSPAPAFDDRFPARDAFPPAAADQDVFILMSGGSPERQGPKDVTVDLLRAVVFGESDVSAVEYGEKGGAPDDVWKRAHDAMEAAEAAADLAVEQLVA